LVFLGGGVDAVRGLEVEPEERVVRFKVLHEEMNKTEIRKTRSTVGRGIRFGID
jgi:hypothetical protein